MADQLQTKQHDLLVSKVKMKDAGKKIPNYPMPVLSSKKKNVIYPCLYLNAEQVPSLKDKQVGDEVKFVISAKVTSENLSYNSNSKQPKDQAHEFGLEVQSIGTV